MARLVIDTNCLLQCISRRSIYHDLWVSLLDGRNTLCVSTEILEEYTELFQKFTSAEFAEAALGVITNNIHTEFITPYYHFNLIPNDPDDNKFVDCAIAGNAKYIVTNDHHYDVLRNTSFPHVDVISLDDFMAEIV